MILIRPVMRRHLSSAHVSNDQNSDSVMDIIQIPLTFLYALYILPHNNSMMQHKLIARCYLMTVTNNLF